MGEGTSVGTQSKINSLKLIQNNTTINELTVVGNFLEVGELSVGNVVTWGLRDATLSVEEHLNKESQVEIYPNPVVEKLNIQKGKVNWILYNSISKKISEGNSSSINFENLVPGMYFVKINNEQSIKIIKKK